MLSLDQSLVLSESWCALNGANNSHLEDSVSSMSSKYLQEQLERAMDLPVEKGTTYAKALKI